MKDIDLMAQAIKKWKRKASGEFEDKKYRSKVEVCCLCGQYNDDDDAGCYGCPIKEYTRAESCKNTPFYETSNYGHTISPGEQRADNAMVNTLYEVRRYVVCEMINKN